MNIEQMQKDMESGVLICRSTWEHLLTAAQIMSETLKTVAEESPDGVAAGQAARCLNAVAGL